MAGWIVENTLSDTQSLCRGVWGWVPEQYFDLNLLIDRAEREVGLCFILFYYFVLYFILFYHNKEYSLHHIFQLQSP